MGMEEWLLSVRGWRSRSLSLAAVRHDGEEQGTGGLLELEEPSPYTRGRSWRLSTEGHPVPSHGIVSEGLSAD